MEVVLFSTIGSFIILVVFLFHVFLFMSQVTVTTSTPPVTIVCSSTSLITLTVTVASTAVDLVTLGQHYIHTAVDLAASGQHGVVQPPPFILRDTVRSSVDLATVPQQQQPQSYMPFQAYVSEAVSPSYVSFSFRVDHPTD